MTIYETNMNLQRKVSIYTKIKTIERESQNIM